MANFTEDSRLENWLKQRGVKFEYRESVRYDELAKGWNSNNEGRPDSVPKDDLLIEKYASAMAQGAVFPSPIIAKTLHGFEVLDGCQRLCAADICGQSMFNAYIIKTDNPSVRASIRICSNSVLNGTSPSQEWTIGKIVDILHEQYNYTPVDCSQWSGQPVEKIEVEIASRDARRWLKINGVDTSLKPANQKGFLAAFAKLAPISDRIRLANELVSMVKQLQGVKSNNSEAVHLLEECLDVPHVKGANIQTLVVNKTREVFARPEVAIRMSGPRKNHPIDNVITKMTGTLTSMRNAIGGDHHMDQEQSESFAKMMTEMETLSLKLIPGEYRAAIAESMTAAN